MKALNKTLPARRVLAIAIGALVLGGTSVAMLNRHGAGASDESAQAPQPSLSVAVLNAAPAAFDRVIAATGTVGARDELLVGSDANGVRLTDVLVDVGSIVRKGQLLARADDRELQAQLAQHEALVRQAQAELTQAQINLERAESLKDSGVYSVEVIQTRRTAAASAAAQLELADAQRRELEVKIAHTRVEAPASGVIARRTATVGAVLQPGSELFRLIRDGRLEWRAELPSHSLVRVRAGAGVRITLDDGRSIDAAVRMVAPTIDAGTRNGLVYVDLPAGTPLIAGGHARGEILVDKAEALALPESSVLTRDGYAYVYAVGADHVARLARVETGARARGMVEIVAGLSTQTRVVGTGAGFVKDGDLVRVSREDKQTLADSGERS